MSKILKRQRETLSIVIWGYVMLSALLVIAGELMIACKLDIAGFSL